MKKKQQNQQYDLASYQQKTDSILSDKFNKQEPIRKGCRNIGGCFCTGECQEIIGWRDKQPTHFIDILDRNGRRD